MAEEYPDTVLGMALKDLAADGNDMSTPMTFCFEMAAPDEFAASSVAAAASRIGYETSVEKYDVDPRYLPWTCNCSKTLMPTYQRLLAAECELEELAKPFGAYFASWTTEGDLEKS